MSRRFRENADDVDKEDDNGDEGGLIEKGKKEDIKCKYKKGLNRAKKVVISPFSKFKKIFKKQKRSSKSSSTSNSSSNATRIGSYVCCLCLSKPQTLDTSSDEIDPNDPNDSYESLKSLIEKNDFYSKECNTHLGD